MGGSTSRLRPDIRTQPWQRWRDGFGASPSQTHRRAQGRLIDFDLREALADFSSAFPIRDNGKRQDRKSLTRGLPQVCALGGIRQRAKRNGKRLNRWNMPGAGSMAAVTFPAQISYGTLHRHEELQLFARRKVKW